MNKSELEHKVSIYANNTEHIILASSADPKTKQLAKKITSETCELMAAIIDELCN